MIPGVSVHFWQFCVSAHILRYEWLQPIFSLISQFERSCALSPYVEIVTGYSWDPVAGQIIVEPDHDAGIDNNDNPDDDVVILDHDNNIWKGTTYPVTIST